MAKKPDKNKHSDIRVPDKDIKLKKGESFNEAVKEAAKKPRKKSGGL